MMTTEQQIRHIAQQASEAAAKRNNNWPGIPVTSLPLSLFLAVEQGVESGRLEIASRPSARPGLGDVRYVVARGSEDATVTSETCEGLITDVTVQSAPGVVVAKATRTGTSAEAGFTVTDPSGAVLGDVDVVRGRAYPVDGAVTSVFAAVLNTVLACYHG